MPDSVYIFLDNSNIFITSQTVCEQKEGFMGFAGHNPVRLHFINLMKLADCGREVTRTFSVGSASHRDKFVWEKMEDLTGVRSAIYERGQRSKSEQAVDETLQLSMYRTLANEPEPQVAVLLTGDGKGFGEGVGFLKALYDMHSKGWGIEVLSWEESCHHELREFAEQNGVFVPLDNYYYSITYVPQARNVVPLSLVGRKVSHADPQLSEAYRLQTVSLNYETLQESHADLLTRYSDLEQKYQILQKQIEDSGRKKDKYDKSMKSKKQKHAEKPTQKEVVRPAIEREAPQLFAYKPPTPLLRL